jgi:hypothetical protein
VQLSDSQTNFNNLLDSLTKCNNCNKFLELEQETQLKKTVTKFTDSLKLAENWIGTLSYLYPTKGFTDGSMIIEYEMTSDFKRNKDFKLEGKAVFVESELDSALLYNQIKGLQEGSKVYFDGVFLHDLYEITDYTPRVAFLLVSITREKTPEKSEALRALIDKQLKTFEVLQSSILKNTTEKELQSYLDSQVQSYDSLVSLLNAKELQYNKSLERGLKRRLYDK